MTGANQRGQGTPALHRKSGKDYYCCQLSEKRVAVRIWGNLDGQLPRVLKDANPLRFAHIPVLSHFACKACDGRNEG
jgi:hypothetical protein